MKLLIKAIFFSGVFVLTGLLVASWAQSLHPIFDSPSHFRLHFAFLLFVAGLMLAMARKWRWTLFCIAVAGISVALSWPYLPGVSVKANPVLANNTDQFRVGQFNLLYKNKEPEKALAVLRAAEAEVFLFQEFTYRTQAVLDGLKSSHPFQLSCTSKTDGSVAMASMHPFAKGAEKYCSQLYGFVSAKIIRNGKSITVSGLHSYWPWPFAQSWQRSELRSRLEAIEGPAVLAGDFNAAAWSHAVQSVATWSNMKVVRGYALTWKPVIVELNLELPALLGIDQIMHSKELKPVSRDVLEDGGSDHLPVVTVFQIDG